MPKPKDPAPLLNQPIAQFQKKAEQSTVRELVAMRETLKPVYDGLRGAENDPKNTNVIRRWDTVEWFIQKKSGPSGGE